LSPSSDAAWLRDFDRPLLFRIVNRRSLEAALESPLMHARPPAFASGWVHALLEEAPASPGRSSPSTRVTLGVASGATRLVGDCSRCLVSFGPCLHMTVLAADLAFSRTLRERLADGLEVGEAAARARDVRAAIAAEIRFDRVLEAWATPVASGLAVEIAASPFAEVDRNIGRAYGDRASAGEAPVLTLLVREAGARKLLPAHALGDLSQFRPRDRRVIAHARNRGVSRKAAYAIGVDASLAVEAMRVHGGVFAQGFKEPLDFRTTPVRPTVDVLSAEGREGPGGLTLGARWLPADGGPPFSLRDAAFLPGPFPFVWTRDGAIYPVAPDVDLELAAQLVRVPRLEVPAGRIEEAGGRLIRASRGRGIVLPPPERFGLEPMETPRIALRLEGEPLELTGQLVAIYRAREVALCPLDPRSNDEGRDVDTEARARAAVAGIGLLGREDDGVAGGEPRERIAASDEAAVEFWRSGLGSLRASVDPPVEVQLSERLAHVRVGAPVTGRVHVALEGHYLATKLEFRSDELSVELDTIRRALAQKRRWVALSNGTVARISSSIQSLATQAAHVMDGHEARLAVHQLGRLDRWIEENDGRVDEAVRALRGRLRAIAVAADPEMPDDLRATLRPYQRLGLAWLQFLQALGAGGILADDMGLGKTLMTLAFLLRRKQAEGPAPSLVVCPTSVAMNWAREAERFTPGLSVLVLHGPARGRLLASIEHSDLVVTTYGLLRRDVDTLSAIRFRCAVLDEAQNIKNASSATARAARRLDASMRLALSGTPVENRLGELWSLVSFANPGMLGTARAFETRFERPIATDRESPLAQQLRSIVRPFLLRRTKNDVLPDLPPKTEVDRIVTLGKRERRMYDALAHTLRASVAKDVEKRKGQTSFSVFAALTRLRQMACDPRLVGATELPDSAKRTAFLELVRELVAEGRRALVFSQFVELLTLWRRDLDAEGIAYEYLDGSTTRREEVVARFQEGAAPLFLISLKAGGAGLNLTAADTVIHCDPWWNPAVEDQATDRAYRIGQNKPVTVVRLVARGTIEDKILSLKATKRALTRAVIGDEASALDGLTADDIRLLLGDADDEGFDEGEPAGADLVDADRPASAGAGGGSEPSLDDALATADAVVDADAYAALVDEVRFWLASTGRVETDLARMADLPVVFANRLAQGEPFPCSRAVARRILARLRAY
jgi:superfamily II DNA or RNA helicase